VRFLVVFDPAALLSTLDRFPGGLPDRRYCVAFSGGPDSTALLHALAQARQAGHSFRLRAIHVNHHLQPQADDWAGQALRVASRLDVPLRTLEVSVPTRKGESIEATARVSRYTLFASELEREEILLTAHHQDDQLETVLLQLLRGAGVAGLAAMPMFTRFAAGWHARPLLDVPRADLVEYVTRYELPWAEDASNSDPRFDRNFLRRHVLPALRQRWPAAAANVSRSAGHMAEAQQLLDEVARRDLAAARDGRTLQCAALRALDPVHARNVLRYWLREQGFTLPSAARLEEIVSAMLRARADSIPVVKWPGAEVRRYRDRLYAMTPLPPAPKKGLSWDWKREAQIELGAGLGSLALVPSADGALRLRELPCPLRIDWREAGARLKPASDRPSRTLRYLFQELGVVPWMRARVPLVLDDDRPIALADLSVDHEFAARPGEPGFALEWSDHPSIY
jgi:tRNA(Ile)-lysidine synthase